MDLYTEDISRASCYRRDYLESVKGIINETALHKEQLRESYFSGGFVYKNRQRYIDNFKKLLGNPLFDRNAGCNMQRIFVSCDSQGYIYRLIFNFEKNIKFYGMLFVPFDAKDNSPFITAIHGGEGTPELCADIYGKNYYSHMVRRLIDKGAVVFVPQLLLWDGVKFGNKFSRNDIDASFKLLGSSITRFECECIMGAVDSILESDINKIIDKNNLGIMGLSYGGYYSIITSVLDERMKSVYCSCVFNDRVKYSRPDFAYTGAADKMLDAEMACLIYPRALYIEAGKNDCFFGCDSAKKEFDRLKKICPDDWDKLVFKATDTGHKLDECDDGINFLIENIK